MKKFNSSMFDSIKGALANQEQKINLNNILQMEVGNTYTVRLLPNINNPAESFFHYFVVGWESLATGQYVSSVSPQTFGERDPILEERFRVFKHGTDFEKEQIKVIKKSEKWLVNAYVVDDTKNPDNNGQVKLIRYGKQLEKIIRRGIDGEDSDEFGARIFDLGPNGVNLKIEVESQGEYPTYVSSRFTSHKADLGLSDEKIEEIYNSVHDLKSVFPVKSFGELQTMYKEHFADIVSPSSNSAGQKPVTTESTYKSAPVETSVDEDDDPIVAELLAGIGQED